MRDDLISRRTLLECAVRLAAMPAGLQFFTAWSQAAQQHQHATSASGTSIAPPQPSELEDMFHNYQPQFFSPADFEALRSFTELLIPTDDTPGAREAHCSEFIDFVLHSTAGHGTEPQKQWRSAMDALNKAGFHGASPANKAALLREIAKPESDSSAHHPAYPAYRLIKRENTFAFYTARAGMIEDLDYRGNSFNVQFPACTHPEHHEI